MMKHGEDEAIPLHVFFVFLVFSFFLRGDAAVEKSTCKMWYKV